MHRFFRNAVFLFAVTMLLSACSGGGGGGGGSTDSTDGTDASTVTSYTVSTAAGANGAIAPESVTVDEGDTTSFSITPETGYSIATASGCDGSLVDNTFTTGVISADCTVEVSFTPSSYTVSTTSNDGGTIDPGTDVSYGQTTSFIVTPSVDYHVASVTGCGGSFEGDTYTTGAITEACTVEATFALTTADDIYTVSTSAGPGGSIDSGTDVIYNNTTSLTVTPDTHYHIDSVTGCSGSLDGNIYTTGNITSACTVEATFAIDTYTVSTSAGDNGSIEPGGEVAYNSVLEVEVTPDTGFVVDTVSGCDGSIDGNIYTTGAITTACTVEASFKVATYTVSTSIGPGGSINPTSAVVNHGDPVTFTLTPDSGFSIDTVSGCGGSLSTDVYTTTAITADCTVSATFVDPTNVAPVADAGLDQVVEVGDVVSLDGSGSFDEDGNFFTYSWSFVSVPENSFATLTGNYTDTPSFTPDEAGTYEIQLVVNDGWLDSDASTVIVTALPNGDAFTSLDSFPIAVDNTTSVITSTISVSGGPASIGYVRVYFDMSHTRDKDLDVTLTSPEGTVITLTSANGGNEDDYSVTVFDSLIATTSIKDGAAPFNGLYLPEESLDAFNGEAADGDWTLTVNDTVPSFENGTLNSWRIVFPDYVPPQADSGELQQVTPGTLVTLDGSASQPADEISFSWELTLVPTGSTATLSDPTAMSPTFTADVAGTYEAALVVTDNVTSSDSDHVPVLAATTPWYMSDDTPLDIPDGDTVTGVTSVIDVTGDVASLSGVEVWVDISHSFDGDLRIYLVSPTGTEIDLSSDNGDNGDNYRYTVFTDDAGVSILDGTAPYTGEYAPEVALSTLVGEESEGSWLLKVYDKTSNGEIGSIERWGLQLW